MYYLYIRVSKVPYIRGWFFLVIAKLIGNLNIQLVIPEQIADQVGNDSRSKVLSISILDEVISWF